MVLFDLDGTLVDTRSAILGAYISAIQTAVGYEIQPDQDHVDDILRRRPIEYFAQHYPPFAETMEDLYAKNYRSDNVVIYQGIAELLGDLVKHEAVGIVSNKGRNRIHSDLRHVGLDPSMFGVIVGAEDTPDRKPHPAPILKALSLNGISPRISTYVGDGPHDMAAAKAAGVRAIGVVWGYYPAHNLRTAGADQICEDVRSLANLLLSRSL